MAAYPCLIGYPWIIDCLVKYDNAMFKQKAVPCQVVELLRTPLGGEDCQFPEALISISDQKYYIRAVLTKEALQVLDSYDGHFTLANLKNKMLILKRYSVCFTAVEDLAMCEFYLTVQHFALFPMETNRLDVLNCNMEPAIRKKIKKLWQIHMIELEMNDASHGTNVSDVSLTQLLGIASEEKFRALKSIAERCLELDPLAAQDIPPQGKTFWTLERKRNKENTERFVIPVELLLIPPHEEEVLEQMTDFAHEGQCTRELADSSEGDDFSQPYSTALSTLPEEPMDEGPSSQFNPWNKLQSLCVSIATSSGSQSNCSPSVAQKSRKNEVGSHPSSSTSDKFICDADVSMGDSPTGKKDISPLMFSDPTSNPQQSLQTDRARSNTNPDGGQGRSLDTSRVKSHTSERKSNLANKTDLFSLSDESNSEIRRSRRIRKVSKREPTPEDLRGIPADLEQQPDCMTIIVSSGEENDELSDNGVQPVARKQMGGRESVISLLGTEKNCRKTEPYIQTHVTRNQTSSKRRIQAHKPSLQFVAYPKTLPPKDSASEQLAAIGPTTSKVCIQEAPPNAAHGQLLSFGAKEKGIAPFIAAGKSELTHHDGRPFQYKYQPPSEDFCAQVKAIQIPTGLCDWALKMSEDQEKVL